MSFEGVYRANLVKLESEHIMRAKVKQRGTKRGQVTKYLNKLENNMPATAHDIRCAIHKLKNLHDSVEAFDSEIDVFMVSSESWTEEEYEGECAIIEWYQDASNNMIINLECLLKAIEQPIIINGPPPIAPNAGNALNSSKLKLPLIELPKFDGQPEMFEQFIVNFEQGICNFSLSEYEKFSLLLKQVSGPAKTMVDSVGPNEQTYTAAKALLTSAFSDETCQHFSVIKKLIGIKFESVDNYYQWISEARTLQSQVERLKIDGAVLLQYYLWTSLPEYVRTHFINKNNTAKPTADVIINSSFDVFNRLRDVPSEHSHHGRGMKYFNPKETIALATECGKPNVNPEVTSKNALFCVLCNFKGKPKDHKISFCPIFDTPESKLKVIEEAGGCTKCGKLNHNIASCRFRFFANCGHCGKFHAHFLCTEKCTKSKFYNDKAKRKNDVGNNRGIKKSDRAATSATSANMIQYNVMSATSNDNIIVPTFTAKVGSKNNVRCMYDPAAQTTFVSEKILKDIDYKIIDDNIKINVSGFNSSKILSTKLVELKFKLNNRREHWKIHAIVVPKLRSRISANVDDIIVKFKEANIPLADRMLSSRHTDDIDILYGVDNANIIPVHACSFGNIKLSLIYYTCQGVMLAGNVSELRENMINLASVGKFIEDFENYFK